MNIDKVLKELLNNGNVEKFAKMIGLKDNYSAKIIDNRTYTVKYEFAIDDECDLILYVEDWALIAFQHNWYDYKSPEYKLHYMNYENSYYSLSNFLKAIKCPVEFNDYDNQDDFMDVLKETLQDLSLLEEEQE